MVDAVADRARPAVNPARPARNDALTSIAAVCVTMVAALAFVPAVSGPVWWWTAAAFALVGVLVVAGGRAIGLPPAAGGLLGLLALPFLATALAGGGQGILLVLPTEGAAQSVVDTFARGLAQIDSDAVPASATPELVLVMALGIAAVAILVESLAVGFRSPLAAVLVVVAVAIIPGRALPIGTNGWLLLALAVGGLLLVVADRRRKGRRIRIVSLTSAGGTAVVLALLAQVVLPAPAEYGAGEQSLSLFGPGVDPLIRLGDDLHRGANVDVLTYTTTAGAPQYLRLATLEEFTGATWRPDTTDPQAGTVSTSGGRTVYRAPAASLSSAIATTSVRTEIVPASTTSVQQRLPLPYRPDTVLTSARGFEWDGSGGDTLTRTGLAAVGSYEVDSTVVSPTAAQLEAVRPSAPPGDSDALALPSGIPSIITRTAQRWTASATSAYTKALAIQNRLRNGAFSYDENTPVQEGYDGDGLGVIAKFLQVKAGYCVHFAATMAVMARIEGIPSRIVVGYQPTDSRSADGRVTATVRSDDLHAWPELYFGDAGWVRFEPTPSRGSVPSYAPLPSATTAAPTQTPTAAESSSAAAPAPKRSAVAPTAPKQATPTGGVGLGPLLIGVAIVLAGLAVLAVPGLLRAGVRRRRRRLLATAGGAAIGWREVLDTATDLGLEVPARGSPRTVAAALSAFLGTDGRARSALLRIVEAVERQSYGGRDAALAPVDLAAVRSAMAAGTGGMRRLVAAVAPRSLAGILDSAATGVRVGAPPGSG